MDSLITRFYTIFFENYITFIIPGFCIVKYPGVRTSNGIKKADFIELGSFLSAFISCLQLTLII